MSISLANPLASLRSRLSRLENILPGRQLPAILPSRERLIVHRRDTVAPATPQGSVPAQGVPLDLMTYNTWGLQSFLGQRQEERMNQIGVGVRGHGIVAMQETFTHHASVVGELANYPYEVRGSDGGLVRSKSGLTMLSSYAVLETDFVAFEQASHADRLAYKGVLFMRVQVPGVGPVDIYTTHFQAQGGDEAIRQHDNDVLVDFIRRHDRGNPTFVMGDFNYNPNSPQYADLVNRLGVRDSHAERNPGDPGGTSTGENSNNNPTKGQSRIDYIFVLPNERFDIAIDSVQRGMTDRINGRHPSDHFAVIGQYRITPRAGATPSPTALRPLTDVLRTSAISLPNR